MQLFSVLYARGRDIILVFFLLTLSGYSYSQTLQTGTVKTGNKEAVGLVRRKPIEDASAESIRLLKKERRQMKKLSNLWKRRASEANASLSALESNTQKKTDRLLASLSNRIDSLRFAKKPKAVNLINQHPSFPDPSITKNSEAGKMVAPEIPEGLKIKEIQALDPLNRYKPDSAHIDRIVKDLLRKTTYGEALGKLEGTEAVLKQNQSKLLNNELPPVPDQEQLQRYAQAKAAKLATAEFEKIAPQIQEAQQKFAKYKKKMEWLKEGSGKNANSLKDDPFSKRLMYGGNVQMPTITPFSMVAAPFVGYRINKKFSAGLSMSYKSILGNNTSLVKSFGGEIGYRSFLDYKLIKHWFVHGEFERMSKTVNNMLQDGYDTNWQTNGYVGIGRQIKTFKNVNISATLLYNVANSDLKSYDSEQFQFRMGISR